MKLFSYLKFAIKSRLSVKRAANEWRNKNSNNFTTITDVLPPVAEIGNFTYGNINYRYFCNKNEGLVIGNYCSIAENVMFMLGGGHRMDTFSTYPYNAYFDTGEDEIASTKGKIVIRDDVWIGYGATIMSGVEIGQGAVIGAESVVTKDVPAYAVFAGYKIIKYRYPKEIIEKMEKFDFSTLTKDDIIKNKEILYKSVDENFFKTDFYLTHIRK